MAVDLAGPYAKLDRAEQHLGDLEGALGEWMSQRPYGTTGTDHGTRTHFRPRLGLRRL